MNTLQEIIGYHQNIIGVPEGEERQEQRDYLKNKDRNLPKVEERHGYTNPSISMDPKSDKPKETHSEMLYNEVVKIQKQRNNIESIKGKMTHHV